jgi:Circularly permutated YpsA SLOG family
MNTEHGIFSKIVSGGQTGADRAALDFAIAQSIPHGGWCPKGRRAEDGVISNRYALTETPDADYTQRTEWNVHDSDGTVIFSLGERLSGGSEQAARFADRYRKPWLHLVQRGDTLAAAEMLRQFLIRNSIKTLNVAGSRESEEPSVGEFTTSVLEALLEMLRRS